MIRFFDILFSTLAIIVITPFMLPIMIILKLTGEHDIFYRQERIGKGGKRFNIIKFATMLRNSPNMVGGFITTPDDPRLLPMGKFLRKTKINELPQILNIFLGQMSVVGYRPFAKIHYDLYSEDIKEQISTLCPGLTGIGSIIFHDEEKILHSVSDREHFHDKIITPYKGKLECWYVKNQTLKNYFLIIFCTFVALFNPKRNILWNIFKDLPKMPDILKPYLL
jgi:lipopolysaccharide/colanic/teichoic acid biosynthesis glycosyltransferase